jgi:hypothetical protein
LFLGTSPASSLGLQAGSSMADIERAALGGVSQWRTRGSDPLADPALVEVCETAARTCEAIFARLRTPSS